MRDSKNKKIIIISGLLIMTTGFILLLVKNEDKVFKKSETSINVTDVRSKNNVDIDDDLKNSILNNENFYSVEVNENKYIKESTNQINESYNVIEKKKKTKKINKKKKKKKKKQSDNKVISSPQNNENSQSKNVNDELGLSNNDKAVIQTLNSSLSEINNSSSNDKSFSDSAKATFINIVDFIFYDGKINGVTFDELTDKGKQEVLKIAQKIDGAIEEKIPGYKETISEKASNAFNKASELIKKGANNFSNFLKEKLGEEDYNAIIKSKDELVYYTKNAVSFIGDVGSSLFNSAKDKLNSWYQDFKNK